MRLATTAIALLAMANGIQIKEDNIPQQLPELELEGEADTNKMEKKQFERYLGIAPALGPPNAKEMAKMD